MKSEDVIVFVGNLGQVRSHGAVPGVVARREGTHVDDGRVLWQSFSQITGETRYKTLHVCVAS